MQHKGRYVAVVCPPTVLCRIGPDGHLIAVRQRIRILLDDDSFQKLAMMFFKECKGVAVVSIVLKSLLHKLKAGVVLIEDFAPSSSRRRKN